jgi:acyl-CoA reductase-like NAD-dependent aldehyde dehydrogenase
VKYPFDIQKYSNVSYFGLAAHLWGEPEKLIKIADSLEVGRVCKNKWSVQVFGASCAVKQSGFGLQDYRTFGDFFSNVKIVT